MRLKFSEFDYRTAEQLKKINALVYELEDKFYYDLSKEYESIDKSVPYNQLLVFSIYK